MHDVDVEPSQRRDEPTQERGARPDPTRVEQRRGADAPVRGDDVTGEGHDDDLVAERAHPIGERPVGEEDDDRRHALGVEALQDAHERELGTPGLGGVVEHGDAHRS